MHSEIDSSNFSERQTSTVAVMAGVELQAWMYGQIAEGLAIDEQSVRQQLESDPTLSEQDILDAYKVADEYNEQLRADLPKTAREDVCEAQIRTHESITFLLWNANEARLTL
jgi:hypothetical protein